MAFRMKPRAIKQLTRDGELVKIHHSAYAAAKALKEERGSASLTNIRHAANGDQPAAYNYLWEWVEPAESEEKENT
jgi:hypothetical protein